MTSSRRESFLTLGLETRSLPTEIGNVMKEISAQGQAAPGGDEVIQAMSQSLLHLYMTEPTVSQGIEDVVTLRSMIYDDQGASQVAGIIRSSIMTDQLSIGLKPYEWTQPSQWDEPITEIFRLVSVPEPKGPLAKRADELSYNLNHRLVMTNSFSRGIGEELLMQSLYGRRFPNGYNWFDIGAALLEIPKQVLAKDIYPFDHVTIMDKLGGTVLSGTTQKANNLLQQPHRVNACVAIDLLDPTRDEPTWRWTHGSLRPKEMSDESFMRKFDGLAHEQPAELQFFNGDLLDAQNLKDFSKLVADRKADIVTLSTILHQLKKKDRDRMLSIAQDLLTDDGLLVIKDFAYIQSKNPRSPRFYHNWHQPGRYRMLVLDKTDPRGTYSEMYYAQDSRNLVLAPAAGKIALDGGALGFNELIESA